MRPNGMSAISAIKDIVRSAPVLAYPCRWSTGMRGTPRFVRLDEPLLREAVAYSRAPEVDPLMTAANLEALAAGEGWAATENGTGTVLGAGGVLTIYRGRGMLWMVSTVFARPRHLVLAARFAAAWIARLLEEGHFRRLEIDVPAECAARCRFAEALGLTLEGTRRRYGPDGSDHAHYARVS